MCVSVQAALAEGLRTEEALSSRAALLAAAAPHKLLEVPRLHTLTPRPHRQISFRMSNCNEQLPRAAMNWSQAGIDEARATEKLQGAAPKLAAWLDAYMRQQPRAPASTAGPGFDGPATKAVCIQVSRSSVGLDAPTPFMQDRLSRSMICRASDALCTQEVLDIEESVWAPRLGLKGNVDASLRVGMSVQPQQAVMQNWLQGQQKPDQTAIRQALVPFEFKTGKAHHSHRAQVSARQQCPVVCAGQCLSDRIICRKPGKHISYC